MTCLIEGCENETVARGLCMKHYRQVRRNGEVSTKIHYDHCQQEGCGEDVYSRGLCKKHYLKLYRKLRNNKLAEIKVK